MDQKIDDGNGMELNAVPGKEDHFRNTLRALKQAACNPKNRRPEAEKADNK